MIDITDMRLPNMETCEEDYAVEIEVLDPGDETPAPPEGTPTTRARRVGETQV